MKIKSIDDLRLWASLGSCRIAELSDVMGCKKQYLENICHGIRKNVTNHMMATITVAIDEVELREMDMPSRIEKNILFAARKTNHRDDYVRKIATEALDRWVMILSRNYGAMQ